MSWWSTTLGVALGAGLAASFPAVLASLPNDPDLRVTIPTTRPYALRDSAATPVPNAAVAPWPAPDGLRISDSTTGAGLDLRTWRVDYSHRWEREVTLPILTGPFSKEGDDVCGYALRLGAGLFDTHGAGAGLEGLVRERLAARFGRKLLFNGHSFSLPQLSNFHLHVLPQMGAFLVEIELELADRTHFSATFRAHIDDERGSPVVRRTGALRGSWQMAPELLVSNAKAMEALFEQKLADSDLFTKPIGEDPCTAQLAKLKPGGVHLSVAKVDPSPGARPRADILSVTLRVELVDGSRMEILCRLRLVNTGKSPRLELVSLDAPRLEGAPFDYLRSCAHAGRGVEYGFGGALLGCLLGPLGCLAGAGVGATVGVDEGEREARARAFQMVSENLKRNLGELNSELAALIPQKIDEGLNEASLGLARLRSPFAPFSDRPSDTVAVRLSDAPHVSPTEIVVPFCGRVEVSGVKTDPAISGPVDTHRGAAEFSNVVAAGASTVELQANADGVNQLLYFLWQSGELRELGTSRGFLDALPDRLKDLAFDVTGLDPGLPPTVDASSSTRTGIGIALGDVKLGDWNGRRVVAHALGALSLEPDGDDLRLTYAASTLAGNCTEQVQGGIALSPCISDLLSVARDDMLASNGGPTGSPCGSGGGSGRAYHGPPSVCLNGAKALTKLTEQLGGVVKFSRLEAVTDGSPIRLLVRVDARVGAAAGSGPASSAKPP